MSEPYVRLRAIPPQHTRVHAAAPKFWDDFGDDPAYHVTKASNIEKVIKLMNGTYDNPGGYPYGMGKDRTVRQWWEYAGMDPADHSLLPRGDKFCFGSTFYPGPHAPDAPSPRRSLRRTCPGLPRMDVAAGGRGGAAMVRAPGGSNIDGVEVYRPSRPRWLLQR
ncbi:hypothetical protein CHLRE_17g732951v5 [Chlamydomonas reinhardtii]|uniref:Uncharacterized protein n=1 Tax=Chlamydomonas reinhardtii TaxID=3055 RepID=A0A2K3CR37_CHLRE|nr:uncharacterized protein CHLRE_17g732951v5 [Chlamydomonas reinhardtii]PNW70748.1 hypothetical protein CHLRE_17g732951v5 [Chlamydomonas reinhardtii]